MAGKSFSTSAILLLCILILTLVILFMADIFGMLYLQRETLQLIVFSILTLIMLLAAFILFQKQHSL